MKSDLDLRVEASKIARGMKRLAPEDQEWVRLWFSVPPEAGMTQASLRIAMKAPGLVRDAIKAEGDSTSKCRSFTGPDLPDQHSN